MQSLEVINKILLMNNLEEVSSCYKINIGFNNKILSINNKYILKICYNENREIEFLKEINFYRQNNDEFIPKLIAYDYTKEEFPFCYMIQKQIVGKNLYAVWSELSFSARKQALYNLLKVMDILHHKKVDYVDYVKVIDSEFSKYLKIIIENSILSSFKIKYLQGLKEALHDNYSTHKLCLIHGDLQFNNVIYLPDGEVKIVDFEHYEVAPIEKEFASLYRMSEDPQSFMQEGNHCKIDEIGFHYVKKFFEENCKEICSAPNFENNMLIYEILNAIRWIVKYPDYPKYHNTLFAKSKKLTKCK